MPILDDGDFIAAIGVYGPSYRLSPEARPQLANDLRELVQRRLAILER